MRSIIIETNLLKLRNTNESDLDYVIHSEREPDNSKYVGQWSRKEHIDSLTQNDILHLLVEDISTKKPVGYVIIGGMSNPHHNIELRRIVISEKGNGYGKETLNLIKYIAFDKLNARRLWLDVREKNLRAQTIYKSVGFVEEGILRECILYNENYESLIVMSILKSEYVLDNKVVITE